MSIAYAHLVERGASFNVGSNTTHHRYGAADLPDSRTLVIQTTKVRMKPEIGSALKARFSALPRNS